ncbi:hypothetical protein GALMADRAFT_1341107 [Galerina marginata CBS 339.88]|uniref:Uncharacterized protein n=1 Tax=Galerina marginata (strain CBS 339.88) TaxID=685588 RepID=A0A067TX77_GALM3|nr:hypothetical protein GALMADRAFT_1341107 [Galerina marginata CBS 339.88]
MPRHPSRPLIFVTLGVLITAPILWGASLVLVLQTLHRPARSPRGYSSTANKQEFHWNVSEVALEFRNDLFHISSEDEWASLIPKVLLPQQSEDYFISMHQQLHCLNLVRIAYLYFHAPPPNMSLQSFEEVDMCMEQLRQNILCNGDITLEPTTLQKQPDGSMVPLTTGKNVIHRCRDWQKLESLLEHAGEGNDIKM